MDNNTTSDKLYKIVEIVGLENEISPEEFEKEIEQIAQDSFSAPLAEVAPDQIQFLIQEWLYRKNKSIVIDWKWELEDLVYNVKQQLPDFEYTEEVDATSELLNIVSEKINPIIEEKYGKTLVAYDTGGDSYGFILIGKDKTDDALNYSYLTFS